MAKQDRFICDRCGDTYNKNHAKDRENRCDFNLVGMALVNTAKQLYRYDLCDACMEELQNWLHEFPYEDTEGSDSEE